MKKGYSVPRDFSWIENYKLNCFSVLNDPIKYLFEKSLEKRVFPDALKIARVTPFLKVEILLISVTIEPSPFFSVSLKLWSAS